jgi:hypothetical protein
MNIQDLTFGIKDVVAIAAGIGAVWAFIYAMKSQYEKTATRMNTLELAQDNHENDTRKEIADIRRDTDEKFLHAKNAKKANIMAIYEELNKSKAEFKEKELQIYTKIEDIRKEQKDSHEKMSNKLDTLSTQINLISTNLAEIAGYIRAKREE